MAKFVANIFIEHWMVIKMSDLSSGTPFSSAFSKKTCIGILIQLYRNVFLNVSGIHVVSNNVIGNGFVRNRLDRHMAPKPKISQ